MCPFFITLLPLPLLESWFGRPVFWKSNHYPVLKDKSMKGYRERDIMNSVWNAGAKDLAFIENGRSNLILCFMLYLGQQIILEFRRIGKLVLVSRKKYSGGVDGIRGIFRTQSNNYVELFCKNNYLLKAINNFCRKNLHFWLGSKYTLGNNQKY